MNDKLRDILHDKFDRIYIIHCTSCSLSSCRHSNIIRQLEHLGLSNDPLVHCWYGTRSKMCDLLYNSYRSQYNYNYNMSTFFCTLDHYNIWHTALDKGEQHILILEDDAHFLKDTDTLTEYLLNIPKDYDVIQFDYTLRDRHTSLMKKRQKTKDYYIELNEDENMWMADGYALSQRGMELMTLVLDTQPETFLADYPHYLLPSFKETKCYISTQKLIISDTFESVRDSRQKLANDVVRLNTPDRKLYVCD